MSTSLLLLSLVAFFLLRPFVLSIRQPYGRLCLSLSMCDDFSLPRGILPFNRVKWPLRGDCITAVSVAIIAYNIWFLHHIMIWSIIKSLNLQKNFIRNYQRIKSMHLRKFKIDQHSCNARYSFNNSRHCWRTYISNAWILYYFYLCLLLYIRNIQKRFNCIKVKSLALQTVLHSQSFEFNLRYFFILSSF